IGACTTDDETIAPAADTLDRVGCVAADQQFRSSLLHGWWAYRPDIWGKRLTRPDTLHRIQLLFKAFPPVMERSRGSSKVVFSPTNPQAKGEVATGERVQAGCLFCQYASIVQGSQQNSGHQANTLGYGSCCCQGNQGVVVGKDQAI